MGCILYEGEKVFYEAIHSCEYVYNVGNLGMYIWEVFKILIPICFIIWIIWVTISIIKNKKKK